MNIQHYKKNPKYAGGMAKVVEHVPRKAKVIISNLSTTKK
jgi:hypothetical protein